MRSRSLTICVHEKVEEKSRRPSGPTLYFTMGDAAALLSSTSRISCQPILPRRASARLSPIITAVAASMRLTESLA